MNTAIARHLARSSKKTVDSFDNVISVAIFSGLGLLISVSVLLLDRYVPGDWFSPLRPIKACRPWIGSRFDYLLRLNLERKPKLVGLQLRRRPAPILRQSPASGNVSPYCAVWRFHLLTKASARKSSSKVSNIKSRKSGKLQRWRKPEQADAGPINNPVPRD